MGRDPGQSLLPGAGVLGEGRGMELQEWFWGELERGKDWHPREVSQSPQIDPGRETSSPLLPPVLCFIC